MTAAWDAVLAAEALLTDAEDQIRKVRRLAELATYSSPLRTEVVDALVEFNDGVREHVDRVREVLQVLIPIGDARIEWMGGSSDRGPRKIGGTHGLFASRDGENRLGAGECHE